MLVGETNEMDTEEEKSADQLRLLMRKHYTVGGLTDVLSVFGPVKDDVRIFSHFCLFSSHFFIIFSLLHWVKLPRVVQ